YSRSVAYDQTLLELDLNAKEFQNTSAQGFRLSLFAAGAESAGLRASETDQESTADGDTGFIGRLSLRLFESVPAVEPQLAGSQRRTSEVDDSFFSQQDLSQSLHDRDRPLSTGSRDRREQYLRSALQSRIHTERPPGS